MDIPRTLDSPEYGRQLRPAWQPGYSPMSNLMFQTTSSNPNPNVENVFGSPSEHVLTALGMPEKVNSGFESSWKTPMTLPINIMTNRKLTGLFSDFALGMALAKTGSIPKVAELFNVGVEKVADKAKTLQSIISTGMEPEAYATASAKQSQNFLDKIAHAKAKLEFKNYWNQVARNKSQNLINNSGNKISDLLKERQAVTAQTMPDNTGEVNLW